MQTIVVLGEKKIGTVRRNLADDVDAVGQSHAIDVVGGDVGRNFVDMLDPSGILEAGPRRMHDLQW
jgi:hypothetical protein